MGAHAEKLKISQNGDSWRNKTNRFKGDRYPIEVIMEGDTGITQQHQRELDKEAVAEFNAQVMAWGKRVNDALLYSIARWIKNDDRLSASMKQTYRHYGKNVQQGQEITSVGFSFKPEGVYVHLGVGKGYNMEGGTVIITKKTNQEWKRKPKPWFNPVIEQHIPELVEIVREYCGNLIVNTTRLYINT